MLEQNRFLAMKKLAKDIRKQNEQTFESFEKESIGDAIREKDEFIESIIDNMDIAFSDGDKGKEEKQIFRANLLIPDDLDFFTSYSKDKNIRNLMNKYAVGIEDIMSKITELNLYSKYIDTFNEKPKKDNFVDNMVEISTPEKEPKQEKPNISPKEAESLLDEIEDLSNAMEELDIRKNNEPEEKSSIAIEPEIVKEQKVEEEPSIDIKPIKEQPKEEIVAPFTFEEFKEMNEKAEPSFVENLDFEKEEPTVVENFDFEEEKEEPNIVEDFNFEEEKEEPNIVENFDFEERKDKSNDFNIDIEQPKETEEIEMADEIENIGSAVSEFVEEYTKVKKELEFTQAKSEKFLSEKEELKKQLMSLKEEKEKIEKQNNDLKEKVEKIEEELEKQNKENKVLKEQVSEMEKTAKQSSDLLKEIYKTIPKKRFNVK